jgi:hypothetical protein
MTVFLYFFLGWTGGAVITLILNHAIHCHDEDD